MDYTKPKRQLHPRPTTPDQPQTPRPLPLPTKLSALGAWRAARSSSTPVVGHALVANKRPAATARSASSPNPVHANPIGRISSEPEYLSDPEGEELPDRYTISYYHILGLPERPDVTSRDIDRAYHSLLRNLPAEFPYSQANLRHIHRVLTDSFKRQLYDDGRHAHLRRQKQARDREIFEKRIKERNESRDRMAASQQKAQRLAEDSRADHLKMHSEELRRQVEGVIIRGSRTRTGRDRGMRLGMGTGMGMEGVDDEGGILYEEDYKAPEPIGERLSLDFEYAGSGSESEGSEDEEEGSGGTFSDREEETAELASNDEPEEGEVSTAELPAPEIFPTPVDMASNTREEPEEKVEPPPASAVSASAPETSSSAKEEREEHAEFLQISPASGPEETSFNLEDECEESVKLLIPTTYPSLTRNLIHTPKKKLTKKRLKEPPKEIWELDYNPDSDTDAETETETDTDTDSSSQSPPPSLSSSSSDPNDDSHTHPDSDSNSNYNSNSDSNTRTKTWQPSFTTPQDEIPDPHEAIWLGGSIALSMIIGSLTWILMSRRLEL
ncbi:hypothetical protein DSL72_003244 [Monilinia vaccinii-corymbosi]|uniref:J domain-containing protein n=1 Tax=Monilinia vaccinii-corymbosi TaxID=61207 RepID=A0A8A3NWD6_9HELO|nr:hypothetical protein DSL72_003244 [Monilinia vaccinii-corymbosi]